MVVRSEKRWTMVAAPPETPAPAAVSTAAARVLVFLVVRTENPAKDFNAFLADLKAGGALTA